MKNSKNWDILYLENFKLFYNEKLCINLENIIEKIVWKTLTTF